MASKGNIKTLKASQTNMSTFSHLRASTMQITMLPNIESCVYSSQAAAVAASETVQTSYGTFDSAIEDMFGEFDHQDNRENPPDNGVLIQLGDRDIGEGDIERLKIQKLPILGISPTSSTVSNKKRKANHQASSSEGSNDINDDDCDDNDDEGIIL